MISRALRASLPLHDAVACGSCHWQVVRSCSSYVVHCGQRHTLQLSVARMLSAVRVVQGQGPGLCGSEDNDTSKPQVGKQLMSHIRTGCAWLPVLLRSASDRSAHVQASVKDSPSPSPLRWVSYPIKRSDNIKPCCSP